MKVLLVNGSPNKEGCTYTALTEIAATLKKNGIGSEIFWIGRKPISGCVACMKCKETGKCVFNDLVNDCAAKLDEFDGVVFGSPVYYASANGSLVSFMDRLFYSVGRKKVSTKPAAAIVSCRRSGTTATFDQLNKYFSINNMPIVTSQYWNAVHGHSPAQVRQDLEGLQTMRTLAQNMAWLLKCIDVGSQAGIIRPEYEEQIMTNFV